MNNLLFSELTVSRSFFKYLCLAFFCIAYVVSASSCASHLGGFAFEGANSKLQLHLIANTNQDFVPFTITLTLRINRNYLLENKPEKLVFLWIETKPSGSFYRAQEEFPISPEELENDQFFYRTYSIDDPGTFTYRAILFPDDFDLRKVSNKVNVWARQIAPVY